MRHRRVRRRAAAVSRRSDDKAHIGDGTARPWGSTVTSRGRLDRVASGAITAVALATALGHERARGGRRSRCSATKDRVVNSRCCRTTTSTQERFAIERTVNVLIADAGVAAMTARPAAPDSARRRLQDDPTLGSAKVSHKLREELNALGHQCDTLFTAALGPVTARAAGAATRRALACQPCNRVVRLRARRYDVVDVSSAEGLWFALRKRAGRYRRDRPTSARSHGLEHLNYQRMLGDAAAGLLHKPWTRRIWYPASRLSQVAMAAKLADRLIVLNGLDREFARRDGCRTSGSTLSRTASRIDSSRRSGRLQTGTLHAGALFCGTWDHVKGVRRPRAGMDDCCTTAASGFRSPCSGRRCRQNESRVVSRAPVRPLVTVIDRVPEERVDR